MLKSRLNSLIWIILLLFCVTEVNEQEKLVKSSIDSLIQKWANRDGTLFQEVGSKLCESFIAHDSIFLDLMSCEMETFHSWVDKLQYSTFTLAYTDPSDSLKELSRATEFKKRMILKAERNLKNPLYTKMSQELISTLNKIYIRFIN